MKQKIKQKISIIIPCYNAEAQIDHCMEMINKQTFIGGTKPGTEDPWMLQTEIIGGREYVSAFSHESGQYEWTGIAQVKKDRITFGDGHVYQLLEAVLPVSLLSLRTKEIDTPGDYEKAVEWVRNHYSDC